LINSGEPGRSAAAVFFVAEQGKLPDAFVDQGEQRSIGIEIQSIRSGLNEAIDFTMAPIGNFVAYMYTRFDQQGARKGCALREARRAIPDAGRTLSPANGREFSQ
jgi:hypothetical protein